MKITGEVFYEYGLDVNEKVNAVGGVKRENINFYGKKVLKFNYLFIMFESGNDNGDMDIWMLNVM